MKNLDLNNVKMNDFENGGIYHFESKDCDFTLTVVEKKSGHGSGKKTVIFGKLEATCKDGNNTKLVKAWENNNDNKGGCDILTLRKYLQADKTGAPKGMRKANKTESLVSLLAQYIQIAKKVNTLVNYTDCDDDKKALFQATRKMLLLANNVTIKQLAHEKANTETATNIIADLTNKMKHGELSPQQLAQITAMLGI